MKNNIKNKPLKFWNTLKRLLKYGIVWKKSLIFALILLTFASVFEILCPLLISVFIKQIINFKNINKTLMLFLIIGFIIFQISAAILSFIESIIINKISVRIIQIIRTDTMKAALNQPIYTFDKKSIGQIISKVTNDTENIKELYDTVVPTLIRSIILIAIMIITIFSLEWKMAIIASSMFPIVIIVMIIYQKYSIPLLRQTRSLFAEINNNFNEIINGMNVIQQFNQEKKFYKKLKNINFQHYLLRMKILKLDGFLLRPLLSLLTTLVLCGLMTLLSLYSTNMFEISILYTFINYLGRLSEPLIAITNQQSILQQSVVSGERVFNLIDSKKQKYGKIDHNIKNGKIEIKKLNFSYKKNHPNILKNININIKPKEFVAFVGSTGSGKTTLAHLLMGYYLNYNGKILIDDISIKNLTKKSLRKSISIVQQEPIILADTIYNNIDLGRNISEKKIWEIIKKIQLDPIIKENSNGIHSILKEQGNNLSTGEKQLLSLARVLVNPPKILILDEATSNIDSETELKIQKTLDLIRKKTTLISIAHRLSTIVHADRIFFFYKGKIKEEGNHINLMKKKEKYWKMYNLQLKEEK
ncbi:SmdB family multidrug efflux ABC transporter permease/ATP-binding protein [Buchnera aphidicola (Kurisakia onigurumii)]|uniref:SmdB family multidrug efflux ABC transporter permease/ATP-binding protein n=1 Tax=Buchnera aphidicola TaxID=9 RepID=UPI0031B70485